MRELSSLDPDFPRVFLELKKTPCTVFIRGAALDPTDLRVGIVGARKASERARALARRTAHQLAREGAVIVSGGAMGIDTSAHLGALEAGGKTVVIMPTPLDRPHPRLNADLFERIVSEGGTLLSESPPGTTSYRGHFSARNRLIAALSDVVVVVEAGLRSGARHTVRAAQTLERKLAVFPWAVGEPERAYNVALMRERVPVVVDGDDVFEVLGRKPRPRATTRAPGADSDLRQRVCRLLEAEPRTLEALARDSGLKLSALLPVVSELELSARVTRRGPYLHLAA